jgi:hypothetical protein
MIAITVIATTDSGVLAAIIAGGISMAIALLGVAWRLGMLAQAIRDLDRRMSFYESFIPFFSHRTRPAVGTDQPSPTMPTMSTMPFDPDGSSSGRQ